MMSLLSDRAANGFTALHVTVITFVLYYFDASKGDESQQGG